MQNDQLSFGDIWKDSALLADVAAWVYDKDLSVERGIVDVSDAASKLTKLYEDKTYRNEVAEACYKITQNPAYRWDRIADAFNKAVQELSK